MQANRTKPEFIFNDSIRLYERQSHSDQRVASSRRVEANGVKNSLIYDRLQHLKMEIENDRQNRIVNLYNGAVVTFNEAVNNINNFINYRNKQFTPAKSDADIQGMLDIVTQKIASTRNTLGQINNADANVSNMIVQIKQSIDDTETHLLEQQVWLKTYFTKGKSGRKAMFYERKISIFGKPVN